MAGLDDRIIWRGHYISSIDTVYSNELVNHEKAGTLMDHIRAKFQMPNGSEVPTIDDVSIYINPTPQPRRF